MSLYCLCEQKNDKPDHQAFGAPNRYCAIENHLGQRTEVADMPPLALPAAMVCLKTGAAQVVLDSAERNMWTNAGRPNRWRRHYPNVDVFECPTCGARVAKDHS